MNFSHGILMDLRLDSLDLETVCKQVKFFRFHTLR